jgi:hypothetical protein
MSVPAASDPLCGLSAAGASVWLDDPSRELPAGGGPKKLIANQHVRGVTANPAVFARALSKGDRCTEQPRRRRLCPERRDVLPERAEQRTRVWERLRVAAPGACPCARASA